MLNFISLSLKNFLSYGNNVTNVKLDRPGTTLIVGEDLDNTANGHGANGVGKTVIINALIYGLYDKTISDISKDNLINNINKKNMEVTVTFTKENIFYKVIRVRKGKHGNSVQLLKSLTEDFKTFEDITPDSVSNTNSLIENIIGIPHELFVRIVVFSATHTPFLDLPVRHASAPSQTAIIEELFELTDLQKKSDVLKTYIKENEQNATILTSQIETYEREHERHQAQIKSSQQRVDNWEETHKRNIEDTENKLSELSSIDFDAEQKIIDDRTALESTIQTLTSEKKQVKKSLDGYHDQIQTTARHIETWNADKKKSINDIETKLGKLANVDVQREQELHIKAKQYRDELTELATTIRPLEDKRASVAKKIKEINKELDHLENKTCPYCLQTFKNTEDKIQHCEEQLKEFDKTVLEVDNDLELLLVKKDMLERRYKEANNQITVKNLDELLDIKGQSETLTLKLASLKEEVNPFVDAYIQLEDKLNPEIDEAVVKIKEIEQQLIENDEKLDALPAPLFRAESDLHKVKNQCATLQQKVEDLRSEVNPFVDPHNELLAVKLDKIDYDKLNTVTRKIEHQKFLLKLLTKKDSFVRKNLLNKNIPFLNTRLQYYLSLLGLPHKVEFTHELTARITQFNHELSFGNLSNGQKARVNIALAFAFRDVLEKLHLKINVCMLDEVLDVGLDTIGVQAAARMLKRKARDEKLSLYIVSHRDEVNTAFDNLLTIQMHNGFSSVKENEEINKTK